MRIGVPKEIKDAEYRVGMTPASVNALVRRGHSILVERDAGLGAGLSNDSYVAAGATLTDHVESLFENSDLIVKVKEPLANERKRLRPEHVLFTYLHLAADHEQTKDLINSGATCIAYETVTSKSGGLPLLTPMSEIAGRLAPQVGSHCLEKSAGGRGILLGGVPGVSPAKVVIIGCGVSGTHAAMIAIGMAADVAVIDRSLDALRRATTQFGDRVRTIYSTPNAIAEEIKTADLVILTALAPGAMAPKLITYEMLKTMKSGSVIVDISIDQGGCSESSRPTTHSKPTYLCEGVVHYCVTNMPGAVPRTSTFALNNATLPYIIAIADKGWQQAMREDSHLRDGLNVHGGHIVCEPVAAAFGLPHSNFVNHLM